MKGFNVSTNIIRDQDSNINYIITKNSKENFNSIASNFYQNNKFQAIIGSYGTGKSTFLWALEQNLKGQKNFFALTDAVYPNIKAFEFVKLIGEYKPLAESLAKALKIRKKTDDLGDQVLSKLDRLITKNTKRKIATVLIIDEFGKFLEYAVKNNPDKEVYYIQQLAELFNDPSKLALSISSLHQNFQSYGGLLSSEQRKEWEKVKGRLKEIPFNEPIDQLLFFASERNPFSDQKLDKKNLEIFNLIKKHNVSDKKQTIDPELGEKLLPLDYISAEIMTKSLQRYGQNERSLFTFLDIVENYSFKWFFEKNQEDPHKYNYYNLDLVFDYILEHYYFVINSNSNSDLTNWNSIKSALDQVDTRLQDQYIISGRKIVKTIGLLNIFSNAGANINKDFLVNYATMALGVENAEDVLNQLEEYKIISYKAFKHRYVFVDWTDLNIDFELQNASQKIQTISNIDERVAQLDEFHPVLVKKYYFNTGSPRFFEYKFSKNPFSNVSNEADAYINYIFPEEKVSFQVEKKPILHVLFNDSDEIKNLFFEIEKAKKVIKENINDRSAVKELEERIFFHIQDLRGKLIDDVFSNKYVDWYYKGKKVSIKNRLDFNTILNKILQENYDKTPIFKSELVNKSKLSTPISLARKKLILKLLDDSEKENLGFDPKKFPPEKTIYLSLIKSIGLHRYNEEVKTFELGSPDFSNDDLNIQSYKTLWEISLDFLEQSKKGKKNIKDLVDALSKNPLKLKRGFIDFWIPLFLIIKKDDYALFNEKGYIPNLNIQVFDVMYKSPHKFMVKAFDVSGIKLHVFNRYKKILNLKDTEELPKEKDFINAIKPFILFVRSLPDYTLNTKNLPQQYLDLRDAIKNAKDPEKAFFEDFPKALNYSEAIQIGDEDMLEGFVTNLNNSLRELRNAYPNLLDRFEKTILNVISKNELSFEEYQKQLQNELKSINTSFLNPELRNIQRKCVVPITDRKIYLEGIAFAVLGKSLEKLKDEEESILHQNFTKNYKRLLELVEIHELKKVRKEDNVYGIKILNEHGNEDKHQVVIPSNIIDKIDEGIEKINLSFNGCEKDVKKAILIELLKNEINE